MTRPLEIKSICGYWQGSWPLGADLQIVEFTDGTRIETRDPVIAALRTDLQHHRCQIGYALRHMDGWCDCEDEAACRERARAILRGCDYYRHPPAYLDALAKEAPRPVAVAARGGDEEKTP